MSQTARRALALVGALAWIAFAIGAAAHEATDGAGGEPTHESADCPICGSGGLTAVQAEPPTARVDPEVRVASLPGLDVAARPVACRLEFARGPPSPLIT